jgi:hypothetical protein
MSTNPFLSLSPERYKVVLDRLHISRLRELQLKHDSSLFKEHSLRQSQQSGTQQHLTSIQKRRLAKKIGDTKRKRMTLLNQMERHVNHLGLQTPQGWKKDAIDGRSFWESPVEMSNQDCPSSLEIKSIVELFLKRQRAWEHLTMVLPREIFDAVNFFKSIKTSAIVSSEAVLASPIAPELAAYRSGIHISCMDIASSASQSLDACCSLYNYLDTLVSPESQIIADIVVDDTSAVSRGYNKLYSAVF